MAAVAQFFEDNGAQTNGPVSGLKGLTRTTGVSNMNWKNTDDTATVYSSSPITAGANSYEKYQGVVFTGAYNQISNGLWQHVSGVLGAGLQIIGVVSGSGTYTTPATTTNPRFIKDMTLTGVITTGYAVRFGAVGPEATGKGTSTVSNPGFSEYVASQLITTVAAAAGDTSTCTFQFQYDEN